MAFQHHKATQISQNYELLASQKPAPRAETMDRILQNVELPQKTVTTNSEEELGISKELQNLQTFQETQKKRGALEAKELDRILQNRVKPHNKGDDPEIWKQKSVPVCEG